MALDKGFRSADTLLYAGDVNIERMVVMSASGVFQNIKQQVLSLLIYEDIFSPFISGKLIIKDSLDLHNVFPLIGEEILRLKVSTPSFTGACIEGDFAIYKMTDKIDAGNRSVAYELNFISIEAITDQNKTNSKVYSGKISDIVGQFVHNGFDGLNSKKNFNVETTRNTIKYISPFWSPIKNLSFLSENAISETQSPSFLFFENRDGFNFRTLETLYSAEPTQRFIQDNYTRDSFPGGGNILNSSEDYKRISQIMYVNNFDYVDRIRSGMHASKLVSYDSTKKTYTVKEFSLKKRFGNQKHLNTNPPYSPDVTASAAAMKITFPRAFETFSNFGDTTNARIIQERVSFLKLAENQKIEISVLGRFDYTVGQTVYVTIHKKRPISKRQLQSEYVDHIISGKYLIAAIAHDVSASGHSCILELIKDSMEREV